MSDGRGKLPGRSSLRPSQGAIAFGKIGMKKRLLNRCENCGHTWFPQGFDLSRRCPNCGSTDVDFTGRLYLAMLVLMAIAAGVLWATDRPHKPAHAMATPPGAPAVMKPR